MAPDRQVRVMVVDDHEIMRDGLREVLQRTGDYEVVGQAGDGVSAVNIALRVEAGRNHHGCDDALEERYRRV